MGLKDAWNALVGKSALTDIAPKEEAAVAAAASDTFQVVKMRQDQLSTYQQIPMTNIAALGAVFSQLPVSARTIVQSVTKTVATDRPLYVGIRPEGVLGELYKDENGITIGNFMQPNSQGRNVISGRMRFKEINELSVNETVSTVVPFDPTLMIVAVALMTIEKKLDGIQKSVNEVLQFLKQEKQSRQRGNLNMLTEIKENYKLNCQNEKFCMSRLGEVMLIKTDAFQDIDFYQNQISAELQKKKGLHGAKASQSLVESVSYQFAEYQLACYLYGFSSFLDILLQQNFDAETIKNVTDKMTEMAKKYDALYADCHAQITQYQRSSLEAQIIGGIGTATKGVGKAIASIPVIREGPVDEALIYAGESIGRFNQDAAHRGREVFEALENNQIDPFVDELQSVGLLYNTENAMITDGENLYILRPKS